jgi:citrate lyase subunit gamma (acyl carrier protein)
MNIITQVAQSGTVESSDILINLAPAAPNSGILIELSTPTPKQYGQQIRALIQQTLVEYGIENALVQATDKGALDYTIKARLITAIKRACCKKEEN